MASLSPPPKHHYLNDGAYQRELTISIYTEGNLAEFDERSRRLIRDGV
jgi:hypothetical protein